MQCFLIVLLFSVLLVPISLQAGPTWYVSQGRNCTLCPPGEYQKSCTVCVPCPPGSYTAKWNREGNCHRCYGDCKPDYNLKVVQNCTSTSDLKCTCDDGYSCSEKVTYSTNCRYCVRDKEATSTEAAVIIQGTQGNGTHLKTEKTKSYLAAILCPVFVVGFLFLVILLFVLCRGDESCYKQAMSKLCIEGGRVVSHKPKEPTLQPPRDSFHTKQQPSPLSATNLGPVHVHNPGTVIVSLLNHFTGQVGPTIETVKTVERSCSEEENRGDCPVFHPTSSSSIHLSEEERSAEIDSMFIPSQEQGKDCHVSKEEVL